MREIIYKVLFEGIDAGERKFTELLALISSLKKELADITVSDISLEAFAQQVRDASNGALNLESALNSIEQTVTRLNLQLAQSGAQINATFSGADEVTRLRQELAATRAELQRLEERLEGTDRETSQAVRSLQDLEEALRQARAQAQAGDLVDVDVIKNLRNQINILNKALLAFGDTDTDAAARVNAQIEQLRQQLERAQAVAKNGLFERGSLPELQLQLQRVQRELRNTSEESPRFADLQNRLNGIKTAISALGTGDNLKDLRSQLKALNNELIGLGDGSPERARALANEIEKVRQQIEVAQAVSKRGVFADDSLVADRLQLQRLNRELDTLSKTDPRFDVLTQEAERLATQLRAAERASGRFQRNVGNYPSLLSGVTRGFRRIGAAVLTAFSVQEVIFRTRDAIESVLETTVDFSGEISRAVSLAQQTVSELEDTASQYDINFEGGIDAVAALEAQLDRASNKAREFAAVSNFTAQEVGKTFTQLGRSGFSLDQIFQVTPEAQTFALAAGEELEKSTDVLISALRTYNTEAELSEDAQTLASNATNIFTGALTSANIDLEQFNEAFKQIAPTAAQFDQDLASVSNTIAELGNRNLRGTIATTSLRTAFNRLVGDIPAVGREINRLNIDLETQEGQLKPIPEIIRTLNEAYADYTPAARAASLSVLVGNRAINQFNVLLSVGADELEKGEARLRAYTANVSALRANLSGLSEDQEVLGQLGEIGVDVQFNPDSSVNVRDLVGQLDSVFDSLDETTRFDLISNLFGGENADLIVSELERGEGAAEGLGEALDRASRSGKSLAEEIAAVQLDSLENQVKLVQSAIEEFSLSIGTALEPAFRSALKETQLFVTAFAEALKGTEDVTVLTNFQDALSRGVFQEGDLERINGIISGINSSVDAFTNLFNVVKTLGPAFLLYRGALQQAALQTQVNQQGIESLTRAQRVQFQSLNLLRRATFAVGAPFRFLGSIIREGAVGFRTAQVSGTGLNVTLGRMAGLAGGAVQPFIRLGRAVRGRVTSAFNSLGTALRTNPLFLIVGAISLINRALESLAGRTGKTGERARFMISTFQALANFLGTAFVDTIGVVVNVVTGLFNTLTFNLDQAEADFAAAANGFSASANALDKVKTKGFRDELKRNQDALESLAESNFSVVQLEERLKQQLNVASLVDIDDSELKDVFKNLEESLLGSEDELGEVFSKFRNEIQVPLLQSSNNLLTAELDIINDDLEDARDDGAPIEQIELLEAKRLELENARNNRRQFILSQFDQEQKQVEANLAVLLQQISSERAAQDLSNFDPPTLDPGSGEDALKDLEQQADKILQRLESVGDRANERLEARFLEDLVTREEFQVLSIERQVALVQDGLNRINETRRKARQEDIDEERVYLTRQLSALKQSSDERAILRQADFFSQTDDLKSALTAQEITQAEFNARFAQQELDLADELAAIQEDSLATRLGIIAGENSEVIDRVPEIRERLAQERAVRRDAAQDALDQLLQQQNNLEDALSRNFAKREDIERQYTENLIQIEIDRNAELDALAANTSVAAPADQITAAFEDRINNLQIAYDKEEELLTERERFLDLRATRLNVERVNTEREFNDALADLSSERTQRLRQLRVEDANLGVINANVAQFDQREQNLTDTYTRQLEIIERQGTQVTAALAQVETDQVNALSSFNNRRLELQQSLNNALAGLLSESNVDGSAIASTFIERGEVLTDAFETEIAQIEQQTNTTLATIQRLNQSRITLEQRYTQDIAGIGVERKQAEADLNSGFITQTDFDTLEAGLDNRQELIERVFAQDIERIEQSTLAAESALSDAYQRRNAIDADFYAQILQQQQEFSESLAQFNVEVAPNVDANPATLTAIEQIFTDREAVLNEALQTELALLAEQTALINDQLSSAVDLRDRTDVIFTDQIDALEAFQAEIQTLAGVSFDIQGPGIGEVDQAELEVLDDLARGRREILENSQAQEEAILSRRESVLLDAVSDTDVAISEVQQKTADALSGLAETQQALLDQVGVRVDLTQFEAYFDRRNEIVSEGFTREVEQLNDRSTEVREKLDELTAAQLNITEQSRVDLLAIDAQFQRDFAQAIANGESDQQLDLLRSQNETQTAEVIASYDERLQVLTTQEGAYLDLLQNFSQQRTQAENNFFTESAQNFQRGTQLLASTLSADNDFLIDFSIDATFTEELDRIQGQLATVNAQINEAQVQRLDSDANFTEAQRQQLDDQLLNLQVQRSRLTQEQFGILVQFNTDVQAQQEEFIRTLGENLEGEDLFSGLSASLEVEVGLLEQAYSAANAAVQEGLNDRLEIQSAIDERERLLIEGRRVNLEDQAQLERSLLDQIADSVEFPELDLTREDLVNLDLGELINLTSDIEGLDAFEAQIRQVIEAGQSIATTFDAESAELAQESADNRAAIDTLREDQVGAYEDYLASLEAVGERRDVIFGNLVEEGVIPERVAEIQREADALIALQAEVRELENARNDALLQNNQDAIDEIEGQLAVARDSLNRTTTQVNGAILAELLTDYDETLRFVSRLNTQLIADVNALREKAIDDAQDELKKALTVVDADNLIDDDIFATLVEGAERAGAGVLKGLDLSAFDLNKKQLDGLSAALDLYREQAINANDAQSAGLKQAAKDAKDLLTELQNLVEADILRESETAQADVEFELNSDLNNVAKDALAELRQFSQDEQRINDERRFREIAAELEAQQEITRIRKDELQKRLDGVAETSPEAEDLKRELRDIQQVLESDEIGYFEDLQAITQDLSKRELKDLREELEGLISSIDDPALRARLETALSNTQAQTVNTAENVADNLELVSRSVNQVADIINEAFGIDENLKESDAAIDDILSQQQEIDQSYRAQIRTLEELIGIQAEGTAVTDARNLSQRLAATGVTEALEDELSAVRNRYKAEQQVLDDRLEQEQERNDKYAAQARALQVVQTAAALASAIANSISAVAKFSDTAALTGPAAFALIPAFVAVLGAAVATTKSLFSAGEQGGKVTVNNIYTGERGGSVDYMELGGMRTKTARARKQRMISAVRKPRRIKRGVKLPGRSHKSGGIYAELERNEFVSSVPTVKMFEPQLQWLNEQGNNARDGKPFTTQFPAALFPTNPTTASTVPHVPRSVVRDYGRDGGTVEGGGSSGMDIELLEGMMSVLEEQNEILAGLRREIPNQKLVLPVNQLNQVQNVLIEAQRREFE